jgi:hypothetical protein
MNHPKHGQMYLGLSFASKNGIPVLFQRRYIVKDTIDLPSKEGKTPKQVQDFIISALESSYKRAGIEPCNYPDIDKKIKKATAIEITSHALKNIGNSPASQSAHDKKSLQELFRKFILEQGFGPVGWPSYPIGKY